jgi:hypothetical protein
MVEASTSRQLKHGTLAATSQPLTLAFAVTPALLWTMQQHIITHEEPQWCGLQHIIAQWTRCCCGGCNTSLWWPRCRHGCKGMCTKWCCKSWGVQGLRVGAHIIAWGTRCCCKGYDTLLHGLQGKVYTHCCMVYTYVHWHAEPATHAMITCAVCSGMLWYL